MTQAPSIFTTGTLQAWSRLPMSVRLGLVIVAMIGVSLLAMAAIDTRSNLPAVANAAVGSPAVRDPSVPEAGQAISGEDRQQEVSAPTF